MFDREQSNFETASYEDDHYKIQTGKDPRDEIIARNQRQILDMRRQFTRSVRELKAQFDDYVQQSDQIQQAMFNRIINLKKQIRGKKFL
jgi:hypothetical protein